MLTRLYIKTSFTIFVNLLTVCSALLPSVSFSNDSDGIAFTPNTFDIELAPPSIQDLHVYSQNHEYTEFGRYRDIPFNTNVFAFLGNRARLSSIDVSVKMMSHRVESTFQPIFSISPSRAAQGTRYPDFPVVGRLAWHSRRGDINHRAFAEFAIEACQNNADNRINSGNSAEGHFSQDHILSFNFEYRLKLNSWWLQRDPDTQLTQENSGIYSRLVRDVGNIICHSNTARAPRPPSNQLFVRQVKADYLPVVNTQDRCGLLRGRVNIRTNKPNQQIHYAVKEVVYTAPWSSAEPILRHQDPLVTDSNGVASGVFQHDINYTSRGMQGDVRVGLRLVGSSATFESRPLEYEVNCYRARANTDNIKKLGINSKLKIPRNQLPGNTAIVRPDTPDSRLQKNGNIPALKLNKRNMRIKKHQLPNNAPMLKSIQSNPQLSSPKKESVINKVLPDSGLKQPQSSENTPVLENEKRPALKPKLKNIKLEELREKRF